MDFEPVGGSMPQLSLTAIALLVGFTFMVGYTVGDVVGPIRRATVTALTEMETALQQDVDDEEGAK